MSEYRSCYDSHTLWRESPLVEVREAGFVIWLMRIVS